MVRKDAEEDLSAQGETHEKNTRVSGQDVHQSGPPCDRQKEEKKKVAAHCLSRRLGRLKRTREIKRVLREGRKTGTSLFTLYWREGGECLIRVALVAGKEVGKAVARNRARRLLKEALRGLLPCFSRSIEAVIVASPEIVGASAIEVKEAMKRALTAARLVGSQGLWSGR